MQNKQIIVVGAGLAGCELSYQLANFGLKVKLYEMKPNKKSPAHSSNDFAELVCSNSFRSGNLKTSAVGLMHQELRELKSLIIACADKHKVPAGEALAVDRILFSQEVSNAITNHPNIEVIYQEFFAIEEHAKNNIVVIATGPLTSEVLSKEIVELVGENSLHFFDAIAPIIYRESIDFSKAWLQSRYDKSDTKDYINCELSEEEYKEFYNALISAEYMDFQEWEKDIPYFEGCLPIEIMAKRGEKTLLFGPMKPVGLINPVTNKQPFAVVQLRQDNQQGTLFNMVGFQTKLKYNEQKRVLKMIPALKNAQFAKLGSIHKNTFINSPTVLNSNLSLKNNSNIFFAGQITGCEGYVESTATGLICSIFIINKLKELDFKIPQISSLGAILNHITGTFNNNYQPSNINFGLFPNIQEKIKKHLKKESIIKQSLENIKYLKNTINIYKN